MPEVGQFIGGVFAAKVIAVYPFDNRIFIDINGSDLYRKTFLGLIVQ